MSDDTAWLDATAQAKLVASGQASPRELIDAAIERIERLNPTLNAFTIPMFEEARVRAANPAGIPSGPFRGVPFALKDLFCCGEGELTTSSMRGIAEAGVRAPYDTYLARRFKDAGFVTVGKTNTPEFGLNATTENVLYGPTHNPWKLGYSSGGSSGGSAVAVATGMVPVAHANDGGGSIRIPASACGLVGLKPSRGRVSLGPDAGEAWHGLIYEHVVTRTVRDTAAVLDATHGWLPGDPYAAPAPARRFRDEVGADPGRLRIGLMDRTPAGYEALHPDCVTGGRRAAEVLESLGHHVEVSHPPILDEMDYRPAFLQILAPHTKLAIDIWGSIIGRPLGQEDMEEWTWALGELGGAQTTREYLDGELAVNRFTRAMSSWWQEPFGNSGFDILLSPTLLTPPAPHGTLIAPSGEPMKTWKPLMGFLPFTPIANITGQPAMTLPLHWNDEGLPVGIHFIAGYGREDVLIRLASQLEEALPWADRRPLVHA